MVLSGMLGKCATCDCADPADTCVPGGAGPSVAQYAQVRRRAAVSCGFARLVRQEGTEKIILVGDGHQRCACRVAERFPGCAERVGVVNE